MNRAILIPFLSAAVVAAQESSLEFHGASWVQAGRVEKSFAEPNAINDYNKNWLGNSGALLAVYSKIDDHWQGKFGLGAVLIHLARGSRDASNNWYPFWIPFVDEAQVAYQSAAFAENRGVQVTLGYFPYDYNPDYKNLGSYLLRGYVYPGTLISGHRLGFQGAPVSAFGKLFGAMTQLRFGGFSNDLIVHAELDDKPLYDISIAEVLTWRMHSSLELAAGVNFYRLIPQNFDATRPGKDCREGSMGPYAKQGNLNPCFYLDSVGVDGAGATLYDTVEVSLSGTKVMGRFRLDPKAWFGPSSNSDWVLYGEAAIIGIQDYRAVYDNILRRIPVMVGFNFPGFGLFNLSLELEYYASKNSSDNLGPQNGSPLPVAPSALVIDPARDDWKWSVNASRMLFGNAVLMAQVANDHMRLGGYHNLATGVEAMRRPVDWYWAAKLAYFF